MLIDEFLDPRILIVSGKGGVGKTTVAASLALLASRHGRRVCLAAVDDEGSLPAIFGEDSLSYQPSEMSPGVWAMNVLPEEALAEYLDVQYHIRRVSKVFKTTHFVDFVTTAAPGLKDILILGKIWYLERGARDSSGQGFDTIIVDAPAAGHMLTFLSAPIGLSDALRMGAIRRQADWLIQMLRDPARSRVHLVTLPEEMPVSETLETSQALAGRIGVNQGPTFANAVYSEIFSPQEAERVLHVRPSPRSPVFAEAEKVGLSLDDEDLEALLGYARFLNARRSIQSTHLAKLRRGASQPVLDLPFLFSARLELPDIDYLADVIEERVQKL